MADGAFMTADLDDRLGAEIRICEIQMRDFGGKATFSGRTQTLKAIEGNTLVGRMLSSSGEMAVLVVDGGGSLRTAHVGDVSAGAGVGNGWAGIVQCSAIRDRGEIGKIPLGLTALGTTPRVSGKIAAGLVDVPISFGNVKFRLGDWIAAEPNGIVARSEPPAP